MVEIPSDIIKRFGMIAFRDEDHIMDKHERKTAIWEKSAIMTDAGNYLYQRTLDMIMQAAPATVVTSGIADQVQECNMEVRADVIECSLYKLRIDEKNVPARSVLLSDLTNLIIAQLTDKRYENVIQSYGTDDRGRSSKTPSMGYASIQKRLCQDAEYNENEDRSKTGVNDEAETESADRRFGKRGGSLMRGMKEKAFRDKVGDFHRKRFGERPEPLWVKRNKVTDVPKLERR